MQRANLRELLDLDEGTPAEIEDSLRDLRHINEWFGGVHTTVTLLRRVAQRTNAARLSVLEIGAGRGDLPTSARSHLAREGIAISLTLLDRMPSHLSLNGEACVAADALKLPFHDSSFDVVSCSLFAHHFDAPELRLLAASALRVARRALLINDLIRSAMHLGLVYAGLPLFRSRITWHDAPVSVRRAYKASELREVFAGLSYREMEITRHYLYRMGVLLWK